MTSSTFGRGSLVALLVALAPALLARAASTQPPEAQALFRSPERIPLFGPQMLDVELFPDGVVPSRIRYLVDGRLVAERTEPPWSVEVDFGQENRPFHLEAVVESSHGELRAVLDTPAIRVDEEVTFGLRQLYVTVTRGATRALDLEVGDFLVLDEGRPQTVVTFERGDVPLTAAILVDTSESMKGERLEAALAGARAFTRNLLDLDRAALYLFSDRLRWRTGWDELRDAGSAAEVDGRLSRLAASGNTAVNDVLYVALGQLEAIQGRRVLLLLSDGADVHSALDMQDVLWTARRAAVQVYWIRLADGGETGAFRTLWRSVEENRSQLEALSLLVDETGGRIVEVTSIAAIDDAFAAILSELREQYVLGYYPSSVRHDGSWHEVAVQVDRPRHQARTRRGYIDE